MRSLIKATHESPWIVNKPTPKQAEFLYLPHLECLFGGSAGGGKSEALLMSALQFADRPNYAAIMFRLTYTDLSLAGALMDRAAEWLMPTGARWKNDTHTWHFPSGATLTFGHMGDKKTHYRYQSSEFDFVGFDELTQFREAQYRYLFSRLRRRSGSDIPSRMRSASNPGNDGHDWVLNRFDILGRLNDRPFVPALLTDNPHIDQHDYEMKLSELPEILQQQLRYGRWVRDTKGKSFNLEWWFNQNRYADLVHAIRGQSVGRWISFDTAEQATEGSALTAWAVGDMGADNVMSITEVDGEHVEAVDVPDKIREVYARLNHDRKVRGVIIENKSSGVTAIQVLRRGHDDLAELIAPFNPAGFGDKQERADRAGMWCKRDCVRLPVPDASLRWFPSFWGDLGGFPEIPKKDKIDAFSQLIIFTENLLADGWRGRNLSIDTLNKAKSRV